ncbi:MAG: hypothetical protein CMO80_19330 [Verrucomicrobiales bacterium]|nr:hypothetical protein [Verrucomicrobiales bacterium]|tara:strand:+ start:1383 stop:2099 length:717 start_codon:yes stop_codon:yes gene_type:complete
MTTLTSKFRGIRRGAFTLIELLVVISIIALVASMVVGLAGGSSAAKQRRLTESKLSKLTTAIDTYKLDKGHWPPVFKPYNTTNNGHYTSLFYELVGVTYTNIVNPPAPSRTLYYPEGIQPGMVFESDDLNHAFGVPGVANFTEVGGRVNSYFDVSAEKDYAVSPNRHPVTGVVRPTKPVALFQVGARHWTNALVTNYWNYRLQPDDGHNPNTYDLWAEIRGKKPGEADKVVIGNWNTK